MGSSLRPIRAGCRATSSCRQCKTEGHICMLSLPSIWILTWIPEEKGCYNQDLSAHMAFGAIDQFQLHWHYMRILHFCKFCENQKPAVVSTGCCLLGVTEAKASSLSMTGGAGWAAPPKFCHIFVRGHKKAVWMPMPTCNEQGPLLIFLPSFLSSRQLERNKLHSGLSFNKGGTS